jgi:hypothetical protein
LIGKRIGYAVQYKIGTDATGVIQAVELNAYMNQVRERKKKRRREYISETQQRKREESGEGKND